MATVVVPSQGLAAPPNTCDQVKKVHVWSAEHKTAIRQFTKYCLRHYPVVAHCWQETTVTLAYLGDLHGYNWHDLGSFEVELAELTQAGKTEEAVWLMAFRLRDGIAQHWPDCDLPSYFELVRLCSERPQPGS